MTEHLHDDLLALLEDKPSTAHALATFLREEPLTVIRALKALAAEGYVSASDGHRQQVWTRLRRRKAYVGASLPPAPVNPTRRQKIPPPVPPSSAEAAVSRSWWVGMSREAFPAAVEARLPEMRTSPVGRSLNPPTLGTLQAMGVSNRSSKGWN